MSNKLGRVPRGVNFDTPAGFKRLLPPEDDLDEWQFIAREIMIDQHANTQRYYWPRKKTRKPYTGCIWNNQFRKKDFLWGAEVDGVYCCGVSMEHFFLTHAEYMGNLFESDFDLTWNQMMMLYRYFFVWDDNGKYDQGCGKGIELAGKWLKERFDAVKEAGTGEDLEPEDTFDSYMMTHYEYHKDPYRAKFGDYVQIQNKRNIHVPGGGHAAIFVGLEQRVVRGVDQEVVRVFQANNSGDYNMKDGVTCGWYTINKPDKNDPDFKRIFHFGSVSPISY